MRTRYGVSPWIREFPDSRRPAFPVARGSQEAEVVIVGAGLTGCAAAYACASAGLKVVLLEAGRVGQGSSGRSAGLLLAEPGPAFRDVSAAHGLRMARAAFEHWRRGALNAASVLRRLGVPCALDARESLRLASRDDERVLRREHDARVAAGLDGAWLTRGVLKRWTPIDAPAGLKTGDSFTLDPYRACVALSRAAVRRGARIFERSHVSKIRAGSKFAEVTSKGSTVRTPVVVATTGSATAEFAQLRHHFSPCETYHVLTEPVPAHVRKSVGSRDTIVSDTHSPHHYIRWTADDRMLVTGADQGATPQRSRNAVLVQRTGQLMYELLTMYPVISGLMPAYGWEEAYARPPDGLPFIGPHRNFPRHVFALGGAGDSVTGAFLAARLLVRAVQGVSEKGDDVFSWVR